MKEMTETQKLLEQFVRDRSETAFRELVDRYLNLVYSTALRLVGGNVHLAQDVAQTVFIHLSQRADKVAGEKMGGWLHRDTCFVASKMLRQERRRLAREHEATRMKSLNHTEENFAQVKG